MKPSKQKRKYIKPIIKEHGNLKEITKGTGDGGSPDDPFGCS